jgi:serine-type D-Ala-D-Ala carboxypeptidase (penicillin-binding protein 5/6)
MMNQAPMINRRRWLAGAATLLLPDWTAEAAVKKSTKTPEKAVEKTPTGPVPTAKPVLSARAAILIDAQSGDVLWDKNCDDVRAIASTQKLLTGLIIAEGGALNDRVTVQASDTWVEPTKIGFKAGQNYGRGYLLQTMLVKSCNDIARCLARDFAGSEEAFGRVMTKRAKALGCAHSNFVNASGLPVGGQCSTARDLAQIARAAYGLPLIRQIVKIKSLTFRYSDGRTTTLENTNRLMRTYPYITGMKTGYTNAAGKCLVSSAEANGRAVIAVVLGSSSPFIWAESKRLLDYGLTR